MRISFAVAVVMSVIEALWFYPVIPGRMAVHFDISGIANGWGPKEPFFICLGVVFSVMVIIFGVFSLFLRRLPDSLINLPNKDYWLAPARRQETMDRITDQMFFFGATSIFLLDAISFLCFSANLMPVPAMPVALLWGMLVGFILLNLFWTTYMLRSFRRPRP